MFPPGHDADFRRMYEQEAGTALDRLSRDLLALEASEQDPELVNAVFRDAHNLKGGAAVVGLGDIARVAHAMESILEPVRAGKVKATADAVDALLSGVDAVRTMLPALVAGTPHDVDVPALELLLAAALVPSARRPESVSSEAPTAAPSSIEFSTPEAPPLKEVATAAAPSPPATPAVEQSLAVPVGRLDDLVRLVGEAAGAQLRLGAFIADKTGTDPSQLGEFRQLSSIVNDLQERTSGTRMVPIATVTDRLQRAVRDLARAQGKDVQWQVAGSETELDVAILGKLVDPILHIVRNAVDHGIETPQVRQLAGKPAAATVRLEAMRLGPEVVLTIYDDGGGIDIDALRHKTGHAGPGDPLDDQGALNLIFRSGVSTAASITDVSGRGVGMDAVRANVASVRGRVDVRSELGRFTEIRISVPITLAVIRCLLVSSGGIRFALPMHALVTALPAQAQDERIDGRPIRWVAGKPVPVSSLAAVLGHGNADAGPAVVVAGVTRQHAFHVDELLGQRDVVVKGLSRVLPRLEVYTGTSAEPDGSVLLVLEPTGLIDLARRVDPGPARLPTPAPASRQHRAPHILVVDDALTVRELQRSILERAGYLVVTAVDGEDALACLRRDSVDLVLTDVDMPKMDGLELTAALRADERLREVGIVILTSRGSEADRARGLAVGADGYIVKSQFDESALLAVVERLVGTAQ